MRLDVRTAERLLDFDTRIANPARATDQLEGAVALHNILDRHDVAYLADEVGMGKTYVALGVVALLRHFKPNARVLVIAPRANIQRKWTKEMQLFVKHNVRVSDLRVRMPGGTSARPLVSCERLVDLLRETTLDPDRDFFLRMSSFSLPLGQDAASRVAFRDRLKKELPWVPPDLFDLRAGADVLKDRFGQALNAALPEFDLVVIDEAHNLKHGFGPQVAARNRVIAAALGHGGIEYDSRLPHTGPRAQKVLLLSATPIDDDYAQLWNQLDVVDRGAAFGALRDPDADEALKREIVSRFLVRRVTALCVGGERLTKNLYRREWRSGGVDEWDKPLRPGSERERLTVALVQKKVSEVLGDEAFGASFQIGMLASFESFLETADQTRLEVEDGGSLGSNFDGTDQTDDGLEREGIDVDELNGLARSHRRVFGTELPHPKMDAVAEQLSTSWVDGSKTLVFVRRVRSVDELKARLDVAYDQWLLARLRGALPERHLPTLDRAEGLYRAEKQRRHRRASGERAFDGDGDGDDTGGLDTFFSYFFRGEGPEAILSGARVNRRFQQRTGALATFFSDNHVMRHLAAEPGAVLSSLAARLGREESLLREELRERSRRYLSVTAKVVARGDAFAAAQAAALELLKEADPVARAAWEEHFRTVLGAPAASGADADQLETGTFFSELTRRPGLSAKLWPEPASSDPRDAVRERHLRALLLSSAARLGHASIDLWLVVARHLPTLEGEAEGGSAATVIDAYLDLLEEQSRTPTERNWAAYDELRAFAADHDLILDVNLTTEDRAQSSADLVRTVSALLSAQRPVAGMAGQVNQSLVRQFRLPGYPLMMISTDLLQEGEDLHTFCSSVHHYGLAWTPSALEQRTGRVDRIRSATERRLTALSRAPGDEEKLQVYYPHLADTVERLQVRRVLRRMDEFLRLMHTDLAVADRRDGHVDIGRELLDTDARPPEPPNVVLETAFGVREEHLRGRDRPLAVETSAADAQLLRFGALGETALRLAGSVLEGQPAPDLLLATARLANGRIQPFSLQLGWWEGHLVVRCVSPIGRVEEPLDALGRSCGRAPVSVGIVPVPGGSYNATVEDDVLLGQRRHDAGRVAALIRRVAWQADELEYEHLPGADRPLLDFRDDLAKDVHHAR
ncbi:MAG: DEAD/DEAH box helicase family protein [Thermoleophilaceae bacterium]